MSTRRRRRLRPGLEVMEDRCLLSEAVVEILNKSSYTVTFGFRWTNSNSDAWTTYTIAPGEGRNFWTAESLILAPQVLYDTTSSSTSQTTVNLAQGYGEWNGSNPPPDSSATVYQFENTATGLELFYAHDPTPTNAVVEILNNSDFTITFDFRWTPSSSWTAYTEAPGQGEIFWIPYDNSLAPQALYDTTTSPASQITVNLAQGFGQWTGTGTPPTSAAKLYQFEDNLGGVELYYDPEAKSPTPAPTPGASLSPNWSGYTINAPANSVTAVYGTWNVPSVSANSGGTFDSSTWIGIDGADNETVEQIGTEQDVVNGVPVYRVWWEMFSAGLQQPEQIIPSMFIAPGDSISASVQYITSGVFAGYFQLSIVDNSRPNDSFITYQRSSLTQNPLAQRSTAEWIMEAPSVNGTISRVPNFSTVNFSNAKVVINGVTSGISGSFGRVAALNLGSDGVQFDTTSVLGGSGQSFSVISNVGVHAGVQSSFGLQTSQVQAGTNNPQVIVVGWQGPPTKSPVSHVTVPDDFDGDGKSDLAVYRPGAGLWIIRYSSGGSRIVNFGDPAAGDVAAPGDFDGDGKTDLAVYRPSAALWIIHYSSGGSKLVTMGDPGSGDIAAPGDYDGDGRADLAVYRPSQALWIIHYSSGGSLVTNFGDPRAGDIAAPSDFDGDNKTDLAVYRPGAGLWIIRYSSGGSRIVNFGDPAAGDIAAPGDFDGDGKSDLAVYRPGAALWIIRHSSGGSQITTFGDPAAGDIAVEASPYYMLRRNRAALGFFDTAAASSSTRPAGNVAAATLAVPRKVAPAVAVGLRRPNGPATSFMEPWKVGTNVMA